MRWTFLPGGSLRAPFAVAIAFWVVTAATVQAAPPDPMVTLAGNQVTALRPSDRVADEAPSGSINVQLALRLRNQSELDHTIQQVTTPGSPGYGHYLTPAQFDARFGPSASDVARAKAFLEAHGFQVTAATPGSTLVDARGTVSAAEDAFQTQIGRYRDDDGHNFFANDVAPRLPISLRSIVVGIQGLNNRFRRHTSAVQPRTCPATCASPPYTPSQVRGAYKLDVPPIATVTGSGQNLGLLELDDFRQANIDGFDAAYNLPALAPSRQIVDGGPQPAITNPGEMEAELDIEIMHGIAPSASILVFEGPNTDQGVIDAYGCMVNPGGNSGCPNFVSRQVAQSNSTSWGLCEPNQLRSTTSALHSLFAQAATQGQSFFAASGDTGADDCRNSTLAVDSPASDPYVTGTGGTRLLLNADNSYNSEVAWPSAAPFGSGGGLSAIFARPAWQTGPGVVTSVGAARQVPDISLDAAPSTGYSIYTCLSTSGSCAAGSAGLVAVGGTSAASPAWAAFAAIYNQYAATQAGPNLGFANPTLYQLGSCPQSFPPFNDITSGNNNQADPTHYSATANYDMVTGWGTLRGSDFARDVAAVGTTRLASVSPASGTTAGGTSVTVTGCGFISGATVMIDGTTPATSIQFVSSTTLTASMPPHPPGRAFVTVANPASVPTNSQAFAYNVPQVVAAIGSGGAVWMNRDRTGWVSLGGVALGAPSVVSLPAAGGAIPLFIVTGTDHDLWARTTLSGWQHLDRTPGAFCIDNPAAALVGSSLTVACQGGDHQLYVNSAIVSGTSVPSMLTNGWSPRGGNLIAGPAMANVPTRGLAIMVTTLGRAVYEFSAGGWHGTGFLCNGHAALASDSPDNPNMAYVACQGTDRALWWSQSTAAGWSGASSLGGQLVDGPGIAASSQGPWFYCEGLDHQVYDHTLGSQWGVDGGYADFGAGSAALL